MAHLPEAASGLAGGDEARVGQFIYRVVDDQWWWSDEIYRMHGFEPGQVPTSTDVLQAHKHPDDLDYTREVLDRAVETGEPFSCYHRIIDAQRRVRHVVAVADATVSSSGEVQELRGYLIDLTKPRRKDVAQETADALHGAMEHRATIEQAKGILMFVYGVDPEAAFEILRARSQVHNIKVRALAAIVVAGGKGAPASSLTQRRLTDLLEPGGPSASPEGHDAWPHAATG